MSYERQPIPGRVRRYFTGNSDDERRLHLEESPYLALEYQRDAVAQKAALKALETEGTDDER